MSFFIFFVSAIQCERPRLSHLLTTKFPNKQFYQYNETVEWSCSVGFTLIGQPVQRCQQIGDFQRNAPYCKGKRNPHACLYVWFDFLFVLSCGDNKKIIGDYKTGLNQFKVFKKFFEPLDTFGGHDCFKVLLPKTVRIVTLHYVPVLTLLDCAIKASITFEQLVKIYISVNNIL